MGPGGEPGGGGLEEDCSGQAQAALPTHLHHLPPVGDGGRLAALLQVGHPGRILVRIQVKTSHEFSSEIFSGPKVGG